MVRFLKLIGRVVGIVALLAAAVVAGYVLRGCAAAPATPASAEEEPTLWVCSMNISYHPYYSSDRPGNCKYCGMALIPATSESAGKEEGLRVFTTTAVGRALMDISTSPVERRFVTTEIRMVGKVAYDETRIGYITAWVPGRLDRLFVDYTGIKVNKGDHMVFIYSPELLSAQQEFLQAIKAVEEIKDSGLEIMRDSAQAMLEAARGKLRLLGIKPAQIAEIRQRGTPSDHVTIYAPMGGTVIEKHAQEGMYVQTGTRIYTIVDLSVVWVMLDAYESDLQWLRYGQRATFTTEAYPGETFIGTIAFINPVLDDRTRTVKMRVNVPNPAGKLKPEMFVQALVTTQVGAGGRVMDPELAGKWICRMHPEVVKAEPGLCDICEMDLVTTESQGYLPVVADEAAMPLVIPASAPLITGRRAIVYVELPDRDQPTFEGREIVLGSRTGDYYIVRHGLQEGELVVTNGNFLIDSALQLLAKPSMMTPEGGGGGAQHQHGGGRPESAGPQADPTIQVPAHFRRQLGLISQSYEAVSEALRAEEFEQVKAAFEALGGSVAEVAADSLSGHARMMWKELSMLLANDAVEGAMVEDLDDARRVLKVLARHLERLDEQFGITHMHEAPAGAEAEVPAEFRQQIGGLWSSYLAVHEALAGDDREGAARASQGLRQALAAADMTLLEGEAHMAWMKHLAELRKALDEVADAQDIEGIRKGFAPLSWTLAGVIRRFGLEPAGPVVRMKCPMAFGGQGATWLQADEELRNPYFGASMLKCGALLERISGGPMRPHGDQGHE